MSDRAVLHLRLSGPLRGRMHGRAVPLASGPVRRLLGYLAMTPGQRENRGRLAAMIWETSDEAQARQNLRQALHRLRREVGPDWPGLLVDRAEVALRAGWIGTDLGDALSVLQQGAVPDALASGEIAPDQILAGEAPLGEMYGSWLRMRRRDAEVALQTGLSGLLGSADAPTAERAAVALMRLDPSDEQAARHLIHRYHASGRTGRAIELYDALWTHLEEEFDTEPAPETQTLIAEVKLGAPVKPVVAAPRAAANGSAEHLRIGLAAGAETGAPHVAATARLFRSDLVASLLRFRSFEIVDLDTSCAAVDYRLEVSVASEAMRLMLLAVLIRSRDGVALWSDRWSGLAENWLATQAEVFSRLASALSLTASRVRMQELRRAEVSRGAVDDWLLGNQALDRFTPEGLAEAAACFNRVIAAAPDASMGYSSLARLKNGAHLMLPGRFRSVETHREAKVLGARAVSLDPLDSRAHLARAWAACLLGEYDQAAAGFQLARACNPNDPWTALSSALGASFGGDQALAEHLAGHVLAEGWTTEAFQWGFHAPIRFLGADYAGCVDAADEGGTAIPNLPAWKAAALWHLGRHAEAEATWQGFEALCRARWAGPEAVARGTVLTWFLSLFPIREARQRRQLEIGARGAAGATV